MRPSCSCPTSIRPRGLVWDRDRLYLMHPPHLSAFIDQDGDGLADEEQVLVKNIAFGFKDRPADHTSNGVTLGIDGWLYLAIGDFGFMEAEGTDGRKLQFRGGGVVRVRPDGTGLEIYSRGTRNILEVAARSAAQRLHARQHQRRRRLGHSAASFHRPGGSRLSAAVQKLSTTRSSSRWPITAAARAAERCIWTSPAFPPGRAQPSTRPIGGATASFAIVWQPRGATFTADQTEFLRLTRVTDLDVDANSHLYATSWHGATFTYVGEDVGFIIRLTPKGIKPEPLPDFAQVIRTSSWCGCWNRQVIAVVWRRSVSCCIAA